MLLRRIPFSDVYFKEPVQTALLSRLGVALALIGILPLFLLAGGCGSSSGAANATQTSLPSGESRPSPGVVEAIADLGATVDPSGQPAPAPRIAQIDSVSIAKEGQSLKFSMDVSGKLPDARPADTAAAEWGFLLDTNGDGKPDWGVFARFPSQDNWSWGLYNENSKSQLIGKQFPGTFTRSGTKLTLTLNESAIGSPRSFQWVAYSDDVSRASTKQHVIQAGAHVPHDAWPLGKGWLVYP